jgi:hypothetical protein
MTLQEARENGGFENMSGDTGLRETDFVLKYKGTGFYKGNNSIMPISQIVSFRTQLGIEQELSALANKPHATETKSLGETHYGINMPGGKISKKNRKIRY